MLIPQKLNQGDKIGIISTARKISKHELSKAITTLESWGLEVVFAPNLFQESNQFAGTDEQRTGDLQWAINHPDLKAVICGRGGYGTARIIDLVNFDSLKKHPKWFIGFSDVTVLLSQLFNEGSVSIHGPVALLLGQENRTESDERLKDLLLEKIAEPITTSFHSYNKIGQAKGQLIGGNLSMIHTILGTNSDVNWQDKILFIEDLDEYLYHIDRMMNHLDRTGKLSQLKGLVIGHMSDMNDNTIPFGSSAYEIIRDTVKKYNFPVAFGIPIGHETTNFPVVFGGEYELNVNESITELIKI